MNTQKSHSDRRGSAFERRISAAQLAGDQVRRPAATVPPNGDNSRFALRPMAFSKGLAHDGLGKADTAALDTLFVSLQSTLKNNHQIPSRLEVDTAQTLNLEARCTPRPSPPDWPRFRVWESPLAGHYFEIEGPDPAATAMAPAPRLGDAELTSEMAEVYAMALVRDMRFDELGDPSAPLYWVDPLDGSKNCYKIEDREATVQDLLDALNQLSWFDPKAQSTGGLHRAPGGQVLSSQEQARRDARAQGSRGLTAGDLFRGSTTGCAANDYISQFLLIGAGETLGSGGIPFGAQEISQKLREARPGLDYMTSFSEWLDVQNGVDLSGLDVFETDNTEPRRKFLETPRDLATYVHIDQLYQAYFNACLILLSSGIDADHEFPNAEAHPNNFSDGAFRPTRSGFATFGGPHVLSLMTEVASRALRAVRRQKFQVHGRARPERLGALITLAAHDEWSAIGGDAQDYMTTLTQELGLGGAKQDLNPILGWISTLNQAQNRSEVQAMRRFSCHPLGGDFQPHPKLNFLLPMAFPEGSPMHPAYGAGHATVAGACTTILKAFFQLHDTTTHAPLPFDLISEQLFKAGPGGAELVPAKPAENATIEGELNKLAANISIGRNFAGVHYYTDYYDSLRLGERVAMGILQEQMFGYNEPLALSFTSFDDDHIRIATNGGAQPEAVTVSIIDRNGRTIEEGAWWSRGVSEFWLGTG